MVRTEVWAKSRAVCPCPAASASRTCRPSSGPHRQVNYLTEPRHLRLNRLHKSIDTLRDRMGFSAVTVGRSIELLKTHNRDRHGFRLRTSCLSR